MTIASIVARGRARHLRLMQDTVSIVRTAEVWNQATGAYVPSSIPIYTGPVRLVAWRGNEEHAAEAEVAVIRYRLALPADGSLPAIQRRDVATVTASLDPALVGVVLVLTEPELGSTSSALRWVAEIVS
ncbi:MAG: hypothetical protein HOW97_17125 [Catenulispora sp.]|nr:hypothetical protein [Catenulispora sp.]